MATPNRQICAQMMVHLAALFALIIGDLKLLELVNNIALVTLRDLARCAGRLDVCGLDHAAEIAVELVARPHCRRWPRSRALDPAAKS
ncbi:MAG TPA: hypothetical protein VG142_04900 [Trebonia sp.]|jgi:hypothetical protein|nr:hypothetical protein [Trebonia sp.]